MRLAVLVTLAFASLGVASAAASPPTIESESLSDIAATDATLEAQINPHGASAGVLYQFQLLLDPGEASSELACPPSPPPGYSTCVGPQDPSALPLGWIAGDEAQTVSLDLASAGVFLEPGRTYYFRVLAADRKLSEDAAEWEAPAVLGASEQLSTPVQDPARPSIESESVSNVTSRGATIAAKIDPNGLATEYQFWLMYPVCQNPPAQGGVCDAIAIRKVGEGKIPAGFRGEFVSTTLTDLQPGYSYTYWALATNSAGETVGEHRGFTAQSAQPPSIESESVSGVTETDATLEAQINTEGLESSYTFYIVEEGPPCLKADPPCMLILQKAPIALPAGKLLGSFLGQGVSADLNSAGVNLSPGVSYEYWVTASSAAGTTEGTVESFTALPKAGVEPLQGEGEDSPLSTSPSSIDASPTAGQNPALHQYQHRHLRRHRRGQKKHRSNKLRSDPGHLRRVG